MRTNKALGGSAFPISPKSLILGVRTTPVRRTHVLCTHNARRTGIICAKKIPPTGYFHPHIFFPSEKNTPYAAFFEEKIPPMSSFFSEKIPPMRVFFVLTQNEMKNEIKNSKEFLIFNFIFHF